MNDDESLWKIPMKKLKRNYEETNKFFTEKPKSRLEDYEASLCETRITLLAPLRPPVA